MGLFSSRRRTYVGTTAVRVIEDKNLPDSVKAGLLNAIFGNDDIADSVLDEMMNGIGNRAERAYRYAKGNYPMGLPFSQTMSITMGDDEAKSVLDVIEGASVSIDYCNLSSGNLMHFGWMKLIQQYQYNSDTNELVGLSAVKGSPVYLSDMVPTIPAIMQGSYDHTALEQWGTSPRAGYTPTRIKIPGAGARISYPNFVFTTSVECLEVKIEWQTVTVTSGVETKTKHEESIFMVPDPINNDADYLHVKYTVGGQTKYWAYLLGSGTYPILDGLVSQPGQTFGEFFPFTYFRHNKTPVADLPDENIYKASRKMGKILGMSYDDIHDAIHENPDIADVEQAIMMFATPANSEDPLEQRYLFDFFKKMYFTQEHQFQFAIEGELLSVNDVERMLNRHSITIKDTMFEMALRHDGIYKRNVAGSIGEIGTYAMQYSTADLRYYIQESDVESIVTEKIPVHTYRHQITAGMYEEIEIRGLKSVYRIFDEFEVTADEEDEILLIPIDRSIAKEYTLREREVLYAKGLHYIFNSRVVVKIKWYQQGWFQLVILIVAIVLAFFTYGASLQALAGAIAAGGAALTVALMALLKQIIIGLVVSYAFKLVVKEIGMEAAFLAAIVAAAVGYGFGGGGTTGVPWATSLVDVSVGLVNAINEVAKDLMSDLLGNYNDFLKEAEESMKLLDDAQNLLESKSTLSPFVIFGESPTQFFDRTIHSGNIGVISVEAVTNYVQVALTLPTISDTLGA